MDYSIPAFFTGDGISNEALELRRTAFGYYGPVNTHPNPQWHECASTIFENKLPQRVFSGFCGDTTTATFCGSVRASYDKLLEYYLKAEIIIILPLPRRNISANAQGKTLYDYADVIKQIAGEYGFPFVDLLREGNVYRNPLHL